MIILVFGDSITWGSYDLEYGGWVSRLRNNFEKNSEIEVYNLGISGNHVEDLIKRFEFETKQRLKEDKEVGFIFAIEINDAQFVHSKDSFRTNSDKFKKGIEKLIKLAKKFSLKIYFVGLTPVDESKTNPISWNKDKSYKNNDIKEYDNIIKSICVKNKIPFIEIFNKFINQNYRDLLEDGLYPNSKGHELIYEEVKKVLKF
jgi:lysophospholipase L1-like esterase